jgi:hypothetical protein
VESCRERAIRNKAMYLIYSIEIITNYDEFRRSNVTCSLFRARQGAHELQAKCRGSLKMCKESTVCKIRITNGCFFLPFECKQC